jgi:methylene-fatty-acyl-phospholipid synthase
VGVFYGNRFGDDVPWCDSFPFSVTAHPQYVGTVLTIWGLFLATRFPHPDWCILPAVATMFYATSAHLESRRLRSAGAGSPARVSLSSEGQTAAAKRTRPPGETLPDRA